jgi:hypothetical protein
MIEFVAALFTSIAIVAGLCYAAALWIFLRSVPKYLAAIHAELMILNNNRKGMRK